jgi:hypothetical protein
MSKAMAHMTFHQPYATNEMIYSISYTTLDDFLYFIRKGRPWMGLKAALSEFSSIAAIYILAKFVNFHATIFVFIIPLLLLRAGLMVSNWGQHAFVDELEPESDFRSSIALIDVSVSSHLSPCPCSHEKVQTVYTRDAAFPSLGPEE